MDRKLRIMHGLSEVAGQNTYSVRGLKEIGENAECVVYYKHPFAYPYDKCLNIDKSNRKMFPVYATKLGTFFLNAMRKYDCFHFHFGHSILNGVELSLYRKYGKSVFFEFHGSDLRDQEKFCSISGMPYDPREATDPKQHLRNQKICKAADGIILHDDELITYLPKECAPVFVVPLRVDISQFTPVFPELYTKTIKIVHAPSKRDIKGTKYVLEAYDELRRKYNNIELVLVEGKTQKDAFEIYKTADIIVDQLFAGTYGVFAIESMAMGKPVITYISEEMKRKLPEELPIVSGNMHTVKDAIEKLILDGQLRRQKGIAGREYVENYHNYKYVAYVLRDIYYGLSTPRTGRDAFNQVKRIKLKMESNGNVREAATE